MDTQSLKPCPFCGNPVFLKPSKTGKMMSIICESGSPCIGAGLGQFFLVANQDAALSAWNTRASDAALASQAAEIARLREALKPFAEEARRYEPPEDDDAEPAFDSQFTYGELRRARAALNGEKP